MGSASSSSLLLHSKLLCFSLFFLFLTFYLAFHSSLPVICKFEYQRSDLIQHPIFSYPKSYGEHKYAIPTVHSSCSSSVNFSDYWVVLKEIQHLCMNNSSFMSSGLRYMSIPSDSFAGNFSMQKRKFYFNHNDDQMEIPCGFMKDFPVNDSDRLAMEKCRGVVVVSAIFGNHDKIRQPRSLGSKTSQIVCFFMFIDDITFEGLESHNLFANITEEYMLGAWKIVRVSGKLPYNNPAMNGMIPKYLIHRLFPNSKFSIWLDAKLQLTADPLLLIHSLVLSEEVEMAVSKHPFNIHTMEEVMWTARWKKWGDIQSLKLQMETYCENGLQPWTPNKLPYTTDVPDTALILRKHGVASNLFSCLLFNELEAFNPRDQLGFAYVRDLMNPKIKIHMFEVEVFEHIAVEFRHNLKGENGSAEGLMKSARASYAAVNESACHGYLLKMWGDSYD